ncbi:protein SSUH2 homolog [Oryza brachyantha]|uniref:CR-type domain-containing protein n=1 Tax=Oryza brachyantha TaxID=4533 RepID=J3M0V2_ORYBR|nr:protein SSUH2 homolog [Oryza brachyantha]
MASTPGAGPGGGVASSAQAPSSSPPGFHDAPRGLRISRPRWIVRTESSIRRERPKRPDPPCTICKGTGKIDCRNCFGQGRTNHANLIMLPKGEWPQWCRICGGSGSDYCHRCHGTGEYREPMGFHFATIHRK